MTPEFNAWWNADLLSIDNPYTEETPMWWAWEGWKAGVKAEREACVEACESVEQVTETQSWTVTHCIEAIWARGEA